MLVISLALLFEEVCIYGENRQPWSFYSSFCTHRHLVDDCTASDAQLASPNFRKGNEGKLQYLLRSAMLQTA